MFLALSGLAIFVYSVINSSHVQYNTFLLELAVIKFPIACIRWVLPRPLLPYINNGLWIRPGASATAIAATFASRLVSPTTKFSKFKLGLRFVLKLLLVSISLLTTGTGMSSTSLSKTKFIS